MTLAATSLTSYRPDDTPDIGASEGIPVDHSEPGMLLTCAVTKSLISASDTVEQSGGHAKDTAEEDATKTGRSDDTSEDTLSDSGHSAHSLEERRKNKETKVRPEKRHCRRAKQFDCQRNAKDDAPPAVEQEVSVRVACIGVLTSAGR